jgi:hypothetical protein
MTTNEFNSKYKQFIEPGFEDQGLMIELPNVVIFLDNVFESITKIPGFEFSQIKTKFKQVRFYSNLNSNLARTIESRIEDLILESKT